MYLTDLTNRLVACMVQWHAILQLQLVQAQVDITVHALLLDLPHWLDITRALA